VGGVEEVAGRNLTKYFLALGLPTAERVGTGGTLAYLATEGLGTVSLSVQHETAPFTPLRRRSRR